MKKYPIILLAIIFPLFALSQTPESTNEKPYIEVTGHAIKKVVPDEIYITIILKERDQGREKYTIEMQLNDLQKALTEIQIPLDDLDVSNATADYIRIKWNKKDVVAQSEYTLKVKNAEEVVKVFNKLDELNVDNAFISKVTHSKIVDFKKEVEIEAIKAAHEKAQYLLAAIGQQPGTALKVNAIIPKENRFYGYDDFYRNKSIYLMESEYDANEILYYNQNKTMIGNKNVQFTKIEIEATMYVKFEIQD
ncbi:MAG TPA: SIMPL domain-containing protein [Bacteroidales bacterium]|nr:SIMPL domain-containing protein [Bacteroidales bacterium]HRX97484.1 SIMPL domain-containing protein [Bacteroidales bacterium]